MSNQPVYSKDNRFGSRRDFRALLDDEIRARQEARGKFLDPDLGKAFKTRYTKDLFEKLLTTYNYGPTVRVHSISTGPPNPSYRKEYKSTTSMRSKTRKHLAPNPYTVFGAYTLDFVGPAPDAPNSPAGYACASGRPNDALATNQARTRFVGSVRDGNAAALAVTLAEWGQAQAMIVHRASQILNAFRAAKRGDVSKVQKILAYNHDSQRVRAIQKINRKPRDTRRGAKKGSDLWLEYHFGWVPLMQDIYESCKVLSSNPPANRIKATGKYVEPVRVPGQNYVIMDYRVKTLVCADVYVSNPNLALANQLGIINPATVAWELVPFSFIVDWFIPVGKLLDSFSDLLGYEVRYPFTTVTRRAFSSLYTGGPNVQNCAAYSVTRTLGLPSFRLAAPPFRGFSVARGATAIALVIQQFLSIKKV